MSATFQTKLNLSSSCDWKVKLNIHTGYVETIIVYTSQTWLPCGSNVHEPERNPTPYNKMDTQLSSNQSCRNGIVTVKLFPPSLYVETHDHLHLLSLIRKHYDVDLSNKEEAVETSHQPERTENRITKARINKSNDNFFRRTEVLFNYFSRVENDYGKNKKKITLQKKHWNFAKNLYGEENKCTRRTICRCGSCNILIEIKLI